jgi:TetR/AcrR family transcriptional regulator
MPRGRAPGYATQRDEILARAAELFAHQGYPGTSMNAVAEACGMSKAALYHYVRDKDQLLVEIAQGHVARLVALVGEVAAEGLPAPAHLRRLIERFVQEYASAQNAHRVLTEDVRFLEPPDRERVLADERRVIGAFAEAVAAIRPDLEAAQLHKPLTMLLFGMINWMFTWVRPDGALTHAQMAPLVADLFFGGLPAVRAPAASRKAVRGRERPARAAA